MDPLAATEWQNAGVPAQWVAKFMRTSFGTPADFVKWKRTSLSLDEILAWWDEIYLDGEVEPGLYECSSGSFIRLDDVELWKRSGFTVQRAIRWSNRLISAEDSVILEAKGYNPQMASSLLDDDISAEEAPTYAPRKRLLVGDDPVAAVSKRLEELLAGSPRPDVILVVGAILTDRDIVGAFANKVGGDALVSAILSVAHAEFNRHLSTRTAMGRRSLASQVARYAAEARLSDFYKLGDPLRFPLDDLSARVEDMFQSLTY